MTATFDQVAIGLDAGAPVLLAPISEPDAIRVLLIGDGAIDRGFLANELSDQGFAVRKLSSLPGAPTMPRVMPTSSSSIVTGRRFPASTCWTNCTSEALTSLSFC